jgi:hypothetical protein
LDANAAVVGSPATLPLTHVLHASHCGDELVVVGMPDNDPHAHVFGLDAQAKVLWKNLIPNQGQDVASAQLGCVANQAHLVWTATAKSATVFGAKLSANALKPTTLLPNVGYTSNLAVVGSHGALFLVVTQGLDQRGLRLYRVVDQRIAGEWELLPATEHVMSVGLHAVGSGLIATWVRNDTIEIQKLGLDGTKTGSPLVVPVEVSGHTKANSVEAWGPDSGYLVVSYTTHSVGDSFVVIEQPGQRPPRTEPSHTFHRYAALYAIDRNLLGPFIQTEMTMFGGWLGGHWLAVEAPNNLRRATAYRPSEEPDTSRR